MALGTGESSLAGGGSSLLIFSVLYMSMQDGCACDGKVAASMAGIASGAGPA